MRVALARTANAVRVGDLAIGALCRLSPGGHVHMVVAYESAHQRERNGKWTALMDVETALVGEHAVAPGTMVEPVNATLVEGWEASEP
jgi:hypothetical protein